MCENGLHMLDVIIRVPCHRDKEDVVVRWCRECGAVVVDVDNNGVVFPGKIKDMQVPKKVGSFNYNITSIKDKYYKLVD